jgi:hypothetical protein
MTEEEELADGNAHLASLRSQVRSALLSKKKAEARGALGKLVALSGVEADQINLSELIKGVGREVGRYTSECGQVRDRLLAGSSLNMIQTELDAHIPHWRAFVNDLPELSIARDGLPAHEDPSLKKRLEELEKKLAAGSVMEVLAEWEELGEPVAAARGGFVQMVETLDKLLERMNQKNWQGAESIRNDAMGLVEAYEEGSYRPGCEAFLKSTGAMLRWEMLLKKCTERTSPEKHERSNLLAELLGAKDELERLIHKDPSLKEILARTNAAIERVEQYRDAEPESGRAVRILVILLLAIVLALVAAWLLNRQGEPDEPTTCNPFPTQPRGKFDQHDLTHRANHPTSES